MTDPRHQAPNTPSTNPTSTTIMLATSAFLPFGRAASTGSPTVAFLGARPGAAMTMSSKMPGHPSL
ncbi:hypothetical protein [Nocardia salmonicida]|uniref:hypothetical protein n=1 Tax=Nocardia salmonicida TaxID=53431 RepID=UPI0033E69A75